ncbi:hypothetical protein WJX74_005327 [Apatococcus lobatus]|uniref:Uncharacterized protein n=1 Tax=Apatococcus lobatus TaxID=904363 RepID=A0AAW1RB92_9CHLO
MGTEKGHLLFIERHVANPRGDNDYRQFGSYADVETLSRCIKQDNFQLLEFLPPEKPIKIYLDFDQHPDAPGSIKECIDFAETCLLRMMDKLQLF